MEEKQREGNGEEIGRKREGMGEGVRRRAGIGSQKVEGRNGWEEKGGKRRSKK